MNLYFVKIYGKWGGGGLVVCAKNSDDALIIARKHVENMNTWGSWLEVDAEDIEVIDNKIEGVVSEALYTE